MNENIVNPVIIELSATITTLAIKVKVLEQELDKLNEELASFKNEGGTLKEKPKKELAK